MIGRVLTFIRFSHTVFALPYALGALFLAADGWPKTHTLLMVLLAMVFARTAAMVFNRVADWEIDQRNPRTANRHKLVSKQVAYGLLAGSSAGFLATCSFINPLCFVLSPVALAIIFLYSVTKRYTHFTQLFLGLALAVAPVGAWMAVRGQIDLPPMILAAGVLLWVAGFDIIYATQDVDFDRQEGLKSMVVRFGVARSLRIAQAFHAAMFLLLIGFGLVAHLGAIYFAGLVAICGALFYEHRNAGRQDVQAVNAAFFKSNAFVSFVFLAAVVADLWARKP